MAVILNLVHEYVKIKRMISGHTALEKFVHYSLRSDGVFLLRIVSANAGDLITTDIVAALWKMFLEEEKSRAVPPPALTGTAPKLDDVDHGFQEDLYDPKKDSIDWAPSYTLPNSYRSHSKDVTMCTSQSSSCFIGALV